MLETPNLNLEKFTSLVEKIRNFLKKVIDWSDVISQDELEKNEKARKKKKQRRIEKTLAQENFLRKALEESKEATTFQDDPQSLVGKRIILFRKGEKTPFFDVVVKSIEINKPTQGIFGNPNILEIKTTNLISNIISLGVNPKDKIFVVSDD